MLALQQAESEGLERKKGERREPGESTGPSGQGRESERNGEAVGTEGQGEVLKEVKRETVEVDRAASGPGEAERSPSVRFQCEFFPLFVLLFFLCGVGPGEIHL